MGFFLNLSDAPDFTPIDRLLQNLMNKISNSTFDTKWFQKLSGRACECQYALTVSCKDKQRLFLKRFARNVQLRLNPFC